MDKQIKITYRELDSRDELTAEEQSLMQQAMEASVLAYAPYSGFNVGAALLLENGEIITGNNQENAAYPLGLCAERVAFFAASSHYPGTRIVKCAIYAQSAKHPVTGPVTPCGACRQAMSEYEEKQDADIELIMCGEKGVVIRIASVHGLLPLGFSRRALGK